MVTLSSFAMVSSAVVYILAMFAHAAEWAAARSLDPAPTRMLVGAGGPALSGGLLLGVFAYWGWESAVNLTEETRHPTSTPGRAGRWTRRRALRDCRRSAGP